MRYLRIAYQNVLFSFTAGFLFGISIKIATKEYLVIRHSLLFVYKAHFQDLFIIGIIGGIFFVFLNSKFTQRHKSSLLLFNSFIFCALIGPDYGLFLITLLLITVYILYDNFYDKKELQLINIKKMLLYIAVFSSPSVVYYTLEYYYTDSIIILYLPSILFGSFVFVSPIYFFRNVNLKIVYVSIYLIISFSLVFAYSIYLDIYLAPINMQAFESILNTNPQESKEYLFTFWNNKYLFQIFFFLVLCAFMLYNISKINFKTHKIRTVLFINIFAILLFSLHDNYKKTY